jgi:succinate dehydrogenase hydrophobic anchor subunit
VIVLAVLLWIQAVILVLFMGCGIYVAAADQERYSPVVAWFTGLVFGGTTALTVIAAVVVGGLT